MEHAALQVEDPVGMAKWYADHLGLGVVRSAEKSPCAHFLADGLGRVVLEIYNNPKVGVPDYRATDPLIIHLAFEADDIEATRERLIKAGATHDSDIEVTPAGDKVTMLRDPWGLPLQLVKRAKPMC